MTTEAPAAPAPASDVVATTNTTTNTAPPVTNAAPTVTTEPPPAVVSPTQPAAPVGPPQKYDLRVPVEHASLVDSATLTEFEKIARESGWTNADAQDALESHMGRISTKRQELQGLLRADPTYGGEKLADTDRLARLAIDHIRPEGHARRTAFVSLLNSGVGFIHHPEVMAFLADLGRLIGEESPGHRTSGALPSNEGRLPEEILWPDMKK